MDNNTKKITYTAILTAMNVLLSQLISIPLGPVKALPLQHVINVICAVIVGPWYGLIQALLTSIIRNIFHTGTLFAFPGSMIGALLAGLFYRRYKKIGAAVAGEVIGTGCIGSLACIPVLYLMNGDMNFLKIIIPAFIASTVVGSVIAWLLINVLVKRKILK